ncbi:MAG TPA: class I SAM-dependent methyltransferase [Ohtaekwangia sp.]|nr:class I SAM-dependent methyltransferase [Ohtaekwangia sp.]
MSTAGINAFDKVAGVYDRLNRLVFGKSMVNAQTAFIDTIPEKSKVLILGGGTGWILRELIARKPLCEFWYIDASRKMIALSKKAVQQDARVHFIHGTEMSIPHTLLIDVVITNFYLDLFPEAALKGIIRSILPALKDGGLWLAVDFVDGQRWWHRAMLRVMYIFFRTFCSITAGRLPDWKAQLEAAQLVPREERYFFGGFIRALYCHYRPST